MQAETPTLEVLMVRHNMSMFNTNNEVEIFKSQDATLLVHETNNKKEFVVRIQNGNPNNKSLVGKVIFVEGEAIIEGIDYLPKGNRLSEYIPHLYQRLHKLYGHNYRPRHS